MAFLVAVGGLQFAYCVLAGNYVGGFFSLLFFFLFRFFGLGSACGLYGSRGVTVGEVGVEVGGRWGESVCEATKGGKGN